MQIRAAQAGDIAQILAMMQDLARLHGDVAQFDEASLARDLLGPAPWAQCLVAEAGGEAVGYALLLPLMRAYFGQRGMDLHHLYVRGAARGQGIGAALLAAVQSHARAQGCSYLTVSTTQDNAQARDFYVQAGFHAAPPSPWRYALDLSRD